mgnify:FL=1|jgi:hypothetical protein
MKIDRKKVIKTEPKMIKEGYLISDLFLNALLIGTLIQLAIQVYLNL